MVVPDQLDGDGTARDVDHEGASGVVAAVVNDVVVVVLASLTPTASKRLWAAAKSGSTHVS